MPEGESSSSSNGADENGGQLWRRIRALIFRRNSEPTLREQLEEAITEHEEETEENQADINSNDLSAVERTMLRNLLHFSEHRADDVMVPRSEIVALPEDADLDSCIALFSEHGHSRLPVYRETLDQIVGMVHIKDVFAVLTREKAAPAGISSFIRQPRYVPESMGVLQLLDEMRRTRTHLAIVVDEYSGTEGLVTIEDLVEEIVGEIEDEHDDEPENLFAQIRESVWEADARAQLEDIAEMIDPQLAEIDGDVDTLGGLAFVIAEQVPSAGDILLHNQSGWRLEILEADEKRVFRLRLHAPKDAEEAA